MSIEAVFLDEIYDFGHLALKNNQGDPADSNDISVSQSIEQSPLITPILNENSEVMSYD